MAPLAIRLFGDPVLRERCAAVEAFDDALRRLADGMLETMRGAAGAGLAANQVGILKRMFTWELLDGDDSRAGAWVNPEIVETSEEIQEGEEGCLSFPGLFSPCDRPRRARLRAQDVFGEEHEETADGLLARIYLHEIEIPDDDLRQIERAVILACGTSWHAGLVAKFLFETLARVPVDVDYGSEYRYRDPIVSQNTLSIVITQSGETADTLAALRETRRKGHPTLAICNVVGSSIAREADGGVYLHAGPEIGVASTKAFTSQIAALSLVTLKLGRLRALSVLQGREIVRGLTRLPDLVRQVLTTTAPEVERIAERLMRATNVLYLGRGYNFPVALEGALKLKEISYIHAEGYPAAEMKHGPIALIDDLMPVVFIAPRDAVYQKVVSNVEEVKARGGKVIAIVTEGDTALARLADHRVEIPETLDLLTPVLSVLPLQLLAYYIAVRRGCNVDQPRNLAKSVTVE